MITGGHDGGLVLADRDPANGAEILEGHLVEGHRPVFAHQGGAGEDGDVLEHRLAAIAEAGSAHGGHLQHAAVLVHHQGGEGFTVHFLRQDHQRLAGARHGLQHRHQVVDGADLAVGHQQQCPFEFAHPAVAVGHEIGGAVAAVEGHAFGDFELGGEALALLDGDHAIGAHLVHGLTHHAAHFLIAARAHGGHLADGIAGHGAGTALDALHHLGHGLFHAAAQQHRAGAGSHVAQAFTSHGLGEHGGGGGAIAGLVLGFGGHLQQQLGAEVFERIFEFDLLGNGDAVVHHIRSAELLLQHHIAALRSDGDLHRIGQGIHAALQGGAGSIREGEQLGHRWAMSRQWPKAPMARWSLACGESRIAAAGPVRSWAVADRVRPWRTASATPWRRA